MHRTADEFAGRTREEKAGWLKRILENNLTDELRKLNAARRDFTREQSLDETLERSAARCLEALAADQTSPSMRFERGEQLLLMARAIAELPESQRAAVEMHHLLGLPLVEIATRLNCSKPAVAGLLRRGMKALRARLIEIEEADA